MATVILLALAIGLLLGLLGGGGSVLTVPVLVYQLGLDPKSAIASSLVVVGISSLVAMLHHARAGRVCWKTGLIFAAAGMAGAYGGGRAAAYIPGHVLLLLFAAILLATAWAMMRGKRPIVETLPTSPCPLNLALPPILFDGFLVGTLTGLVGVGGGFMVVPALNLLGGLPMHAAVATSLLVISLNSFAALAGYVSHVEIDPALVGVITAFAIVGSLLGGMLSRRVGGKWLRRVFGIFLLFIAAFLLHRELKQEMIQEALELAIRHGEFLLGALVFIILQAVYRFGKQLHGRQAHGRSGLRQG